MKSMTELLKERMLVRSSDPDRANVIMMIVDGAKKAAKEAGREAGPEDLEASVRSQVKQTEKALATIRENGGDVSQQEKEIAILKSYLPPALSEEEIRQAILKVLDTLPEDQRNKKSTGKIMAQLKDVPNMDLGAAGKILGSLLS